ncbi:WhiB family transcriptional regulator [Lentzea sp. NBRC 102530]|uniref:WhiB family transcriptional regulator n=1 Tax=Lentzea sp. NBRC 102530 TaxID=3032201 RepID=UPI0024A39CC4|nr:WhiB family transcriptional regulator [Lentzea sp. NBRC 102530]GLY55345.1 hypothetical protein Lesp01_90000 [Lentzea sp. NBRC 102530]
MTAGPLSDLVDVRHLRWQNDGLCKETDPEAFYPLATGGTNGREGKRICAACPAQLMCLDWGLHHERYGIWGGTSVNERIQLRKQLGIREPTEDIEEDE